MGTIRNLIKKITQPFLQRGLNYYYRKPREFSYKGLTVIVHPDVFPPHMTLSTKILLDFISDIDLNEKSFLELGCGSGIISLYASQKGAKVTASDINKTALEYLAVAAKTNKLSVTCLYSNLFESISKESFDYIFINPPYYPKDATNTKQKAWFCGENFEYFQNLFKHLSQRKDKTIYMILSEDCDLDRISSIAQHENFEFKNVFEKTVMGEKNFIFRTIPFQ